MQRTRSWTFQRAVVSTLSSCLCFGSVACDDAGSAVDDPPDSGEVEGCNTDHSTLDTRAPPDVSFRRDVMPIFGRACNQRPCHDAEQPAAELELGVLCSDTPCVFPTEPSPMPSDPQPLTDEVVSAVFANLVGVESVTVPGVLRVARNEPDASFLLQKLSGDFLERGYDCVMLGTSADGPCGRAMPYTSEALCLQTGGQERYDLIAAWIARGALDN